MPPAYCPHCMLSIADDAPAPFPPRAMRCPHCRLGVAAGRARTEVEVGAGGSGGAAGVLVNAARRADVEAAEPADIARALTAVAAELDVAVARLRMLDYQRVSAGKADHPDLASIISACGSWKKARQVAADAGEPTSA